MVQACIKVLAVYTGLVLGFAADLAIGQTQWTVGVARVSITPERPMWMAGYASRNHPATGKLTDLWAKALVLEDSRGRLAVLVSLDLVGANRQLSQAICRELRRVHSLERDQIALCFSHTHTGPVVGRNLAPLHYLQLDESQRQRVDQYQADLLHKIVDVVGQAIGGRVPVGLAWGTAAATFAVNRRNNPESQVPALRASGTLAGPADHDVPVLAARGDDGQLVAVLFGYACHATVLDSYLWSGDYPGFAQIEVEKGHPGCLAMFWAGCGADQNPLPRRKADLAKQYGKQLAAAVDRVLATKMDRIEGALATSYREIPLPLDQLPSREEIAQDVSSNNRYAAARARMLLARLGEGRPLEPTYAYPVGVWRFGKKIQFVFLGGEVVVDYALRLKLELGGKRTWVAGYSNDVMAYIPSRRVLREGGYEGAGAMVYYGLPTTWAPDIERRIVDAVHAQTGGVSAGL